MECGFRVKTGRYEMLKETLRTLARNMDELGSGKPGELVDEGDLLISRPMNIEETLKAHIGKELISGEKTDLDLDTDLIGLVDSTGVMELTVWIESTFGFSVEIDDITPENFGTIRRLADWIRRNSTQPAE